MDCRHPFFGLCKLCTDRKKIRADIGEIYTAAHIRRARIGSGVTYKLNVRYDYEPMCIQLHHSSWKNCFGNLPIEEISNQSVFSIAVNREKSLDESRCFATFG